MQTATILSYDETQTIDKNLEEYLRMKRNRDNCDQENFLCEQAITDANSTMHDQSLSYFDYTRRGLRNYKLKIWKPNKFKDSKQNKLKKPQLPDLSIK